ncbi:TPA: hypothetical protein TXN53_000904 [Streptococcus suis]|uniref:hypothetical protein n=1 Tax=Streptococcus suis TaxID=1307 RepID=UPI002A7E79C5|nr:hypothetical protein [Streptococcus suis]HEM2740864.1 hypothetical protein [Streptococcus suis]HEP1798573.1 hypothetical protein [Streptococcus suis]
MNVQQLQALIAQLEQECQEATQRLSAGQQNLNQLSIHIHHYTNGSNSGKVATQITQEAAMQLRNAIANIQTLKRELKSYLNSVSNN